MTQRKLPGKILQIWTDSLSSLHLIRSHTSRSELAHFIQAKAANLRTNDIRVKVGWVKAHAGNEGNEEADVLAKKGALSKNRISFDDIPLSRIKYEFKNDAKQRSLELIGSNWSKETRIVTAENIMSSTGSRAVDGPLCNLLTGHGWFLSHQWKLGNSVTEDCQCSDERQTNLHILEKWDIFLSERQELPLAVRQAESWKSNIFTSDETTFMIRKVFKAFEQKLIWLTKDKIM